MEDLIVDMALLTTTSAIIHYTLGLYGMIGTLTLLCTIQYRGNVWKLMLSWFPSHTSRLHQTLDNTICDDVVARSESTSMVDSDQDEVESTQSGGTSVAIPSHVAPTSRLLIRDLSPNSLSPHMEINTRLPIPFETDLFHGHVYFFIRTCPEDPTWSHLFQGKRRMFWIQVQGKFKRCPNGIVYLGGELPSSISHSLFTKTLALVIMGIVQKLVGKVQYNVNGTHEQVPFVSFPLYQCVDSFMETPEDQIPPPLGREDFGETEQARCRRRATPIGSEQYRVGPTYSFHFHTMYVDLTQWKTVNLPGLSDFNLTTFFHSLPLRLVAYEDDIEKHYLFCFQVESSLQHIRLYQTENRSDTEPMIETMERPLRRFHTIHWSYVFWMEEADLSTRIRRVHYVFRMENPMTFVIVNAYRLRLLLLRFRSLSLLSSLQALCFHTKSKCGYYSDISQEGSQVAMGIQQLQKQSRLYDSNLLCTFENALMDCMTTRYELESITPVMIGIDFHKRERENMNIVYESVVYRFYTETFIRQEVLVVTHTCLYFYRSFQSRCEKTIDIKHIMGIESRSVPYLETCTGFAYAFQINTIEQEMILLVETQHARDAWIRILKQVSTSFQEPNGVLYDYLPWKGLKPAERMILNARCFFPSTIISQCPLETIQTCLEYGLSISTIKQPSTVQMIEFLTLSSGLRTIDLSVWIPSWTMEQQLVFFMNLYHMIHVHAMLVNRYPQNKSQWTWFQIHMCYMIGRDSHTLQPMSFSLAEIEHLILRAKLPRTLLPHLDVDEYPCLLPSSSLCWMGISHRDFRISFALAMNRQTLENDCYVSIPVLTVERVHEQLNQLVSHYLSNQIKVNQDKKTIYLPRICQWYHQDYNGPSQDTRLYCVRKLLGFLSHDIELYHKITSILECREVIHIKYIPFKYRSKTSLRRWVE